MEIECIRTLEDLAKAKPAWDEIYRSDPHASIHRAWPWINGWIAGTAYQWQVLAFRPTRGAPYIAFLPLAFDTTANGETTVYMGGHPLSAHTGFVCDPAHAEEAMSVFAGYFMERRDWARFVVSDSLDPRIELFVKFLPRTRFFVDTNEPTTCPYIELPQTWDDHLQRISPKARYKVRRLVREMEELPRFRVVSVDRENLDQQGDLMLALWQKRWGMKQCPRATERRHLFRSMFRHDCLSINTYWDGTTPIGGVASFVDRDKKVVSAYMSSFNEQYPSLQSPGLAVIAMEVRRAIKEGYRIYDNGRGAQRYKFEIGAQPRFNANLVITRRSLKGQLRRALKLVRRTLRATIKGVRQPGSAQSGTRQEGVSSHGPEQRPVPPVPVHSDS